MSEFSELYRAHVATLVDRTSKALEAAGFERVVIYAGDLAPQSRFDDLEHPFRAVPAYAHWVPWAWPGSALVLEKGRAAKLYARARTDFWEKLEAPHAELVRSAIEVEEITDLAPVREVARKPRSAFVGEPTEIGRELGFDETDINDPGLVEQLHELRVRKTPYEVETLAGANRRAVRGHRAIEAAFRAGERSELKLHLAYLSAIEQDDAETPYKNIVALGEAAAVLHHHHYGTRPQAPSLLVDAGASMRGYGADITRTYVVDGDSSGFGPLIEAMERLQRDVIARIEVGLGYEALHDYAHVLLGKVLVEAGLVRCSPEAAVELGITRVFLPHGLGHALGVQVHDVGCRKVAPRPENAFLRNTRTIEAGQVFTIEPGLYFIDALLEPLRTGPTSEAMVWDAIDPLRPYGGIRIEDNVYVLDAEAPPRIRNLTRDAFSRV